MVLFTNDKTVSKGMVKYASNLSRESIIDVAGTVVVPQEPVIACTQSQVHHPNLQSAIATAGQVVSVLMALHLSSMPTSMACPHVPSVRLVSLHQVCLHQALWHGIMSFATLSRYHTHMCIHTVGVFACRLQWYCSIAHAYGILHGWHDRAHAIPIHTVLCYAFMFLPTRLRHTHHTLWLIGIWAS